jgi:hypothetical protein
MQKKYCLLENCEADMYIGTDDLAEKNARSYKKENSK